MNILVRKLLDFLKLHMVQGFITRSNNLTSTTGYKHAFQVIIPLLGITYIITIVGPTPEQQGYLIFHHLRAVLLSTQVRRQPGADPLEQPWSSWSNLATLEQPGADPLPTIWSRVARWFIFQTKNPYLDVFWRAAE
jgi:hypothetical protein